MKEHPILFSTQMVQAILSGTKTQTRRVVKTKQKGWNCHDLEFSGMNFITADKLTTRSKSVQKELTGAHAFFKEYKSNLGIKCPYGQPDDLLWVRETWQHTKTLHIHPTDENYGYVFKADNQPWKDYEGWKWRPSIHMPKAAARIWLRVKDVRVERVQDISGEDAKAEGCAYSELLEGYECLTCDTKHGHVMAHGLICEDGAFSTAKQSFQSLWYAINGIESWHENPWVWVVEFEELSRTGRPVFRSSRGNMLVEPYVPGGDGYAKNNQ